MSFEASVNQILGRSVCGFKYHFETSEALLAAAVGWGRGRRERGEDDLQGREGRKEVRVRGRKGVKERRRKEM